MNLFFSKYCCDRIYEILKALFSLTNDIRKKISIAFQISFDVFI